ncbi:MAG: thiamine-phosphate kinase [Gammaproteobacteria bacterium]|nr:thiamine-phosphate kinase [Gammaproteobacteria bacterium]NIR85128.1 thiamine-phosphate kinase [Gammaproteobacteria bacterium]NIR92057.1 thiamine-phosphate kinase [Gammaproteobacteria bacterium]NIU06177.1 thiamine-phosphate kinase [Gammaproteobacteria bacterium]NIV53176.1 thiamine-phosphate kinase [Gammaproteobacteria bacterium]
MSDTAFTDLRTHLGIEPPDAGLGEDTTVCGVPEGHALVVSIDTLVGGVHFFEDAPAADVGHKALAVNLSDLAAMGAEPREAMLSLTAPALDPAWLRAFGEGLGALLRHYRLRLQVASFRPGPLTVTVEVSGHSPGDAVLTRSGARPGDVISVTGTLGDAGLALEARAGSLTLAPADEAFVQRRLARPDPRVAAGCALRGVASAAIDVSDGLAADLTHLIEASGVGATLRETELPLSQAVASVGERGRELALSAGDDYELCFTVPRSRVPLLLERQGAFDSPIRIVGAIEAEPGLRCVREDGSVFRPKPGYRHF